jgi:hypothetical protein
VRASCFGKSERLDISIFQNFCFIHSMIPKASTFSPFKLIHLANRSHQHFINLKNSLQLNLGGSNGPNSSNLGSSYGSGPANGSTGSNAGGAKWGSGGKWGNSQVSTEVMKKKK